MGGGIVAIPVYALFSFLIAYCCISSIAGKAGILAYQDLLRQKAAIQEAIDYLQEQNEGKASLIREISQNPRAILGRASLLGYVREGELLIVLPESFQMTGHAQGNEIRLPVVAGESSGLPDSIIRLMAG
ncbi:MAG: septum formation initiator family protein, partial [Rectinema sp.]|nr:septum formation initiator family protein [Rectinema sp.]